MRHIRSSSFVTMPWKNGGGTTTEIAVYPQAAGIAGFEWRLSMARVERGGPFSLFPGVDRSIAILEGDGLLLSVEGEDDVCLDRALAPFAFPGDVAAGAELVGASVLDLNVMTRRDRWRHALVRLEPSAGPSSIARVGDVTVLLARGVGFRAATDHEAHEIADGDALLADATDPPKIGIDVAAGGGHVYVAGLWRR